MQWYCFTTVGAVLNSIGDVMTKDVGASMQKGLQRAAQNTHMARCHLRL